MTASMVGERLQKILAQSGKYSRRSAEKLIADGLVTINGKTARLGDRAIASQDAIKVQGKLLHQPEKLLYLAFHKPKGVISMLSDPMGRPHLGEYLKTLRMKIFPLGQLDFPHEGLLLLTNDGNFAERFQKSKTIPRTYLVKIKGLPSPELIERLEHFKSTKRSPIQILSLKIQKTLQSKTVLEFCIQEQPVGKSRGVSLKGLLQNRGFLVESIKRTAIGPIALRKLLPGEFRYLKPTQIELLFADPMNTPSLRKASP